MTEACVNKDLTTETGSSDQRLTWFITVHKSGKFGHENQSGRNKKAQHFK